MPIQHFVRAIERGFKRILFASIDGVLRNRELSEPLAIADVQRILVLRYDRVGDMIVTLPMIKALRELNPKWTIDVLASESNAEIVCALEACNDVHVYPNGLVARMSTMRRLSNRDYDLVLACLYNKATIIGLMANYIGGRRAVKATLNRGEKYKVLYNLQSEKAKAQRAAIDKNISLIEEIFGLEKKLSREGCMVIPESDRARCRKELDLAGLTPNGYVLINLSVRTPRNAWNVQCCREVIEYLLENTSYSIALNAMSAETAIAQELCIDPKRVYVFGQAASSLEAAARVEAALLVLSPDTAVIHMCSALKRPVVGLYVGDQRGIDEWGPSGSAAYRIVSSSYKQPVNSLKGAEVISAVKDILATIQA